MQSGYGTRDIQPFMVDSCSSLLSISHDFGSVSEQSQKHHEHFQHIQEQHNQPRIHHLGSMTQAFFHHPPFRPFLQHQKPPPPTQQQQQIDHDTSAGNCSSLSPVPGGCVSVCTPHFLATSFSLGMNGDDCNRLHDADTILGCDDGSSNPPVHHRWPPQHTEEESSIKEPLWRPLDLEHVRCKGEKMDVSGKYYKKEEEAHENEERKSTGSNYGLFSELEMIYTGGGGGNQTGSSSVLTGDNSGAAAVQPDDDPCAGIDHGSETSTGEEAVLKKLQKSKQKRKKKKKQMQAISSFFQKLMKQLMNHQENLHQKFLEIIERRDQERSEREEAWKRQEAEKTNKESIARAQEQALASTREAAIVSFLENITGQSINLPNSSHFINSPDQDSKRGKASSVGGKRRSDGFKEAEHTHTKRWPKAEVQALIRVRCGLESRFQEPGLKSPLWEEVSSAMASIGYQRSPRRCKEKWENINKYFRKTKDCAKKRTQQTRTCPYFQQLHQLYSKPSSIDPMSTDKNTELLDDIFVPSGQSDLQNDNRSGIKLTEVQSMHVDFNGKTDIRGAANEMSARQVLLQLEQEQGNEDDQEGEDLDDEEDNEEESDSQSPMGNFPENIEQTHVAISSSLRCRNNAHLTRSY